MAEVNIFDYVTDRLDVLRGDFGVLAASHHDLRVRVAGIQTQVRIMYGAMFVVLSGIIGTFFHMLQKLASLSGKA